MASFRRCVRGLCYTWLHSFISYSYQPLKLLVKFLPHNNNNKTTTTTTLTVSEKMLPHS